MSAQSRLDNTNNGDRAIPTGQTGLLGNPQIYNPSSLLTSDQKIASDLGIPVSQLSPQIIGNYVNEEGNRAANGSFLAKYVPIATVAGATAGIGSAAGAALAGTAGVEGTAGTAGLLGSSIGSGGALTAAGTTALGAGTGAIAGGANATLQGGNIGKGLLVGGALGGIGGALSGYVAPSANNALSSAGVNPIAANAAVRGGIGATTGALGSSLGGGNGALGAAIGGISGASSGAAGAASGDAALGKFAGIIGGTLAGKYLSPSPSQGAPAPTPLVGTAPPASQPPTTPASTPGNIGPYSGYAPGLGYAPMTQTSPNIDYSTYGQGPEASFFNTVPQAQNTSSSTAPPTATAGQGFKPSVPQR